MVEKEIIMDESGKMTPSDPDSGYLKMIMRDAIYVPKGDEHELVKLDPKTNPFEFFEGLHFVYSGALVRVGEVEKIFEKPEPKKGKIELRRTQYSTERRKHGMKVENKYLIDDFIVLFNYFWYRDFPLSEKHKTEGSPAEWNTHIASCVSSCANLMGFFTLFEQGEKTDAIIRNNKKGDVAYVEWEWNPITHVGTLKPDPKVNEVKKLLNKKEQAIFSVFISFSRKRGHKENLETIQSQWKGSQHPYPLLVFLVTYEREKGTNNRVFYELETYLFQNVEKKLVRTQHALPWKVTGTRWET